MTQRPFYRHCIAHARACPKAHWVHEHGFYVANNPEFTEDDLKILADVTQETPALPATGKPGRARKALKGIRPPRRTKSQ